MNAIGEHGERATKVPRVISLSLALISLLSAATIDLQAAEPLANRPAIRRPVAAAVLLDGKTLAVANERSGTISLVDLAAGRVTSEHAVAGNLAFSLSPDGRRALAVGGRENNYNLFAFELSAEGVEGGFARLYLTFQPSSVAIAPSGNVGSITSTWSHAVQFISLDWPFDGKTTTTVQLERWVELSFAPRLQLWIAPERLVVADAFGGHLALLDARAGKVLAQHELNAHNISGLAFSADGQELVLTHQVVGEHAPTSLENIQRGTLINNVLRRIRISELDRTTPPLEERSRTRDLGAPDRGAADPAGVVTGPNDSSAVAFAGVNEIELGRLDDREPSSAVRLTVGRRPTALVRYGSTGLAVLNTFDDSISLIDLAERRVVHTVSLGPAGKLAPQDRGELLFFDGRLSPDGWLSCHSCHSSGHTSGRLADTLGDGTFGTPKRTPTLMGTGLTYRWAWNGSQQNLHDQVQKSLEQTMFASQRDAAVIGDLAAYLVWLPPPPPFAPATNDPVDRAQLARGERFFHSQGCAECHIPPLVYTSHEAYDVGLRDEKGLAKFNPPSLRGVSQSTRFLHDNRAASLAEVFSVVGHPHGDKLSGRDLDDLVRFLNSL